MPRVKDTVASIPGILDVYVLTDAGGLVVGVDRVDISTETANAASLLTLAAAAIAQLDTADALLTASGTAWDAATPVQRTALMRQLVRQNRALIRIVLGLTDAAS